MLQTYLKQLENECEAKTIDKLAKLQQICQQLHDAIREYVSE